MRARAAVGGDVTPPRRLAVTFVVVILLVTLVGASAEYGRQILAMQDRHSEVHTRGANAFADSVDQALRTSATVYGLLEADGSVREDRFLRWAQEVVAQPAVSSVAYEPLVPVEHRRAFEAETGVEISALDGDLETLDWPEDVHLPIRWVWPDRFDAIVGRDLLSEPVRATAAHAARDTAVGVLTEPITLGPTGDDGVLAVTPLYRPGASTGMVAERRAAFVGTVSVAHFSSVVLQNVLDELPVGARLRISNGDLVFAQTDPPPTGGSTGTTLAGGTIWTIEARHPDGVHLANVAWIVGVGGLMASMAGVGLRQSERQVRRLADAQRELAAVVAAVQQESLRLPQTPVGVDVVVRYEPAAEHAQLGGDWYDIFTAPDGRLVISVGDASGHGIEAITHMQRVRQIVSSFAYEGQAPGEVLRLTDGILGLDAAEDEQEQFATVWLGYLDPAVGTLRFASAGHPDALTWCPGSEPSALVSPHGPPVGLAEGASEWAEEVVPLKPGTVIVAFTDGLVEARQGGIDAGLPAACRIIAEHSNETLERLAEQLMDARPDRGRDDVALTVVAWKPAAG